MSLTADSSNRLLVVDDEPELVTALCDALRDHGYSIAGFTDPDAALNALGSNGFDVVLSDMMMPRTGGIQLLKKAFEIDPLLVGIIMTGQGSISAAVEAMRAGAFDFVLKPFRISQILPVVERAREVRRLRLDNDRLRREVEQREAEHVRLLAETNGLLAALATTDALTGLANRRAFEDALKREVGLSGRRTGPLSLLILDVDDFKSFNDTFGHLAGDRVLSQVTAAMRECCRSTDVAARLGGDEFAVLLPATDEAGAAQLAERIRETVESELWAHRALTMSIGVATLDSFPLSEGSRQLLVEAADQALYQAKRAGRNCVVINKTNRVEPGMPEIN